MIAWLSQNRMFASAAGLLLLALVSALHVGQTLEEQLPQDALTVRFPERLKSLQGIDSLNERRSIEFEAPLTVLFVFPEGRSAASGLYEFARRAPATVRVLGLELRSEGGSGPGAVEDGRVLAVSREELLRLGIGAIPVILAVGGDGRVKRAWGGTWGPQTQQELDAVAQEAVELN